MKNLKKLLAILFICLSLTSCAVISTLLGYDECAYDGCDRQCAENCNYCPFHCERPYTPGDLNAKTYQSLEKQMEYYKKSQQKNPSTKSTE